MSLRLSFCGASRQVTGSSHTLTLESGKKILLDCGLFQGRRAEADVQNREGLLNPEEYDTIIVSHAHIDHTGRIPYFVKRGFNGTIYSTVVTKELCTYMLLDSAQIQQADAAYFKEKNIETTIPVEPLYDEEDVKKAIRMFKTKDYYRTFAVNDEVKCTFLDAGHVLGSTIVQLTIRTRAGEKTLVFSGDLGRQDTPILRDPDVIKKADYAICESTYGNRIHEGAVTLDADVAKVINATIQRGGRIIIPAFALERTQELVYRLQRLFDHGDVPVIPVYVDSPMASEVTDVFRRHPEVFDEEISAEMEHSNTNPFSVGRIKYTASVEESKRLNHLRGPMIILSASGMCEEGRIRHHLANAIEDPKNTIMIVGYQAVETLGRKLVDGAKVVSIFRKDFRVRAQVVRFEGFSAHADMNDLDAFVKRMNGLKQIFLVHGELDQQEAFAKRISTYSDAEVIIPNKGEEFELK